jgi:hypothetical protein
MAVQTALAVLPAVASLELGRRFERSPATLRRLVGL